jgi:hypothetical protein
MHRRLRHRVLWILILFVRADLSAQSINGSTFHVSGIVTQLGSPAPNLWITFEGPSVTSVKADLAGRYEAELPLGVWTVAVVVSSGVAMAATATLSHPRVFRVTAPTSLVIDLYLNAVGCAGVRMATPDGRPPTPQELSQKDEVCQGRTPFSLPSDDAVPFEVVVGQVPPSLCSMMHADQKACERQFATYNLLTVYADKVVFTRYLGGGLLEASGNVVVKDDHGEYRRDLANFFIGGGRAVPVY